MKKLTFIVLLNFFANIMTSPRPSEPRIIPSMFSLPELHSAQENDPLMRPFFALSNNVDSSAQYSNNIPDNRELNETAQTIAVQLFVPTDTLLASPGQGNFTEDLEILPQENLQQTTYTPSRRSNQSMSRTPIYSESSTPIARTFLQRRQRDDDDTSHSNSRTQPAFDEQALIRELTQQRRQNLAESRVRRAHYVSPVPPPFSIELQNSRTNAVTETQTQTQIDTRQSQETIRAQSTNHENTTIRCQSVSRNLFDHIDSY